MSLSILRRHKRVQEVSVENHGDLVFVYLAEPWARYGTGRKDGFSKSFDIETYGDPDDDDFDPLAHVKAALNWVRNEVYEDECQTKQN